MTTISPPTHGGHAVPVSDGHLVTRSVATPIGELLLVASPTGLRAVLWPGEDGARVKLRDVVGAATADAAGQGAGVSPAASGDSREAAESHLSAAAEQLGEYFAGTRREFDLTLDPVGTAFQREVWDVLRSIPFGQTRSYSQQAAALGDPAKARAVGAADGRNPISVVVPCHRVVSATGALTGFAGGLEVKAWLLEHERKVLDGD